MRAGETAIEDYDTVSFPYFLRFRDRTPPAFPQMSKRRHACWQALAGLTIGLGFWYLFWRWTASLNQDALAFSCLVASAETAAFLGTCLFFYDIWSEGDTTSKPPPENRAAVHLDGDGAIRVDLFITTYDEGAGVVRTTLTDASRVEVPPGCTLTITLLDDGQQPNMQALAEQHDIAYLTRSTNTGYKAGNLRHALMQSQGDFVVICDADTSLFPNFLTETLGYFRDRNVAWVQTPHWFYDIPEGEPLICLEPDEPSGLVPSLLQKMARLTSNVRIFQDPFGSDPTIFFDVIQRRRNRNGASFCCGAGSIHRREAIFSNGLSRFAQDVNRKATRSNRDTTAADIRSATLQPFCFHVSEDILTSIHQHSAGWRSVYHPSPLARMLSPWSVEAWATQRLKYAGGTFDIMLRSNPLFNANMPWRIRLHYAATFASYLSTIWLPILLFAPAVSLATGIAPVDAYSLDFSLHLIPLLLANELALAVGCKGYDTHAGRTLAISTLPIQIRAAFLVALGRRPRFPPTPKLPANKRNWRHATPAFYALLALMAASAWGIYATFMHIDGYSTSLLVVNLFWVVWNSFALMKVLQMSAWLPPNSITVPPALNDQSAPLNQGLRHADT